MGGQGQKLRTAIIGITGYGEEHLRLLLHGSRKGFLQPVAAVVVNREEAWEGVQQLKGLGCRIYNNVEAMWADQPDAIDFCMIPTPIPTHGEFVRLALEHGTDVFVEKPICSTVEQAIELMALARKKGREIFVGFQDLFDPVIRNAKKRILAGEIGTIRSLKSWGVWPRAASYYTRNNWAGRMRSEGQWVLDSPVMNAMSHFLALLLFWAGKSGEKAAVPLWVEADLYRAQAIENFDTLTMKVGLEDRPPAFIGFSHSGRQTIQPVVRVEGENGWFEWQHGRSLRFQTCEGKGEFPYQDISRQREGMIELIARYLCGERDETGSLDTGFRHLVCVNGIQEAFPVARIAASRILRTENGEGIFRAIEGIEKDLENAYRAEKLLHESSPHFFYPETGRFPLLQYRSFAGVAESASPEEADPSLFGAN